MVESGVTVGKSATTRVTEVIPAINGDALTSGAPIAEGERAANDAEATIAAATGTTKVNTLIHLSGAFSPTITLASAVALTFGDRVVNMTKMGIHLGQSTGESTRF